MQASDAKLWNSDKIVTQETNKGGKDEQKYNLSIK